MLDSIQVRVDVEGQYIELYNEEGFQSDNIWSGEELEQEIRILEKEGYDTTEVKKFLENIDLDLILHSNGR